MSKRTLSRSRQQPQTPPSIENTSDAGTATHASADASAYDPFDAIASMLADDPQCAASPTPTPTGCELGSRAKMHLPDLGDVGAALQAGHHVPSPSAPAQVPRSPYFLEQLHAIREGDSTSGKTWRSVHGVSPKQALALAHIDRTQCALATIASLLHASQQCIRRQPEDFGIGDDRHEGLVYAVRELVDAQRVHIERLEKRMIPR